MDVRVRFAPSPTGYLHVGGLRTALYNWLFAKHNNGKCILRIEDTDRTRFVENATENLINSLKWAGVEFDESPVTGGDYGPYTQSERTDIYREHAQKLIDSGNAYYAFDTAEELDQMRSKQKEQKRDFKYDRDVMKNSITIGDEKARQMIDDGVEYVIRLKSPHDKVVVFKDVIRGEVKVNGSEIDDQILLKSDGFPTYHLANVVDDHLMKISHVIRGEEWLPSTPKHVLLYQAFGWDLPQFAHLPLLLNKKKAKLSKRHGDVAVEDFMKKGYLRDAFVNFIALLGWNPTSDREIFTIDELIENFNLEKVNKGGAVFDLQKLEWMNQQYIKEEPAENLATQLDSILKDNAIEGISNEYQQRVVELFRERITFVSDIANEQAYMFAKPQEYDEKYMKKRWKDNSEELVKPLIELFRSTDDFSHDNLHSLTKKYCEENDTKLGVVIHPIRLMITGKSSGAGMFETMEVLGKEECIERFDLFLEKKAQGDFGDII